MCVASKPKIPKPPPAPRFPDGATTAARDDELQRARLARGFSSTILTGGQGLTAPASTAPKTLLGGA